MGDLGSSGLGYGWKVGGLLLELRQCAMIELLYGMTE